MALSALAVEIDYSCPVKTFEHFADDAWSILLDSADASRPLEDTNRYSYIGFDPFETLLIKDKKRVGHDKSIENPFNYLKNVFAQYQIEHNPQLPPFHGGAMGYFSYDLCHYLEEINYPSKNEKSVYADLAIGLYDLIIAFDHVQQKAWVIASGLPETDPAKARQRAKSRISFCLDLLSNKQNENLNKTCGIDNIHWQSPFTKNSYSQLVSNAQRFILEGDIFEVNLSQRFQAKVDPRQSKYALFKKLRDHNPSPFSAYINLDDHQILSFSPERFIHLNERRVSTRPIKGTAPRGTTVEEDKLLANGLINSEKDRSENIMIVDLLRNDLSKVCDADSVKVKKLCGLESYPTVHHLVSVIEANLKPTLTPMDLLQACFPGGSITGAPKVRAMQIIYELEPTARGPYCGSIGFIGFNGAMDTSIAIRTLLAHDDSLTYQAGGAVVLDSSPEAEYEETIVKTAAITRAFASEANE